ncbi:MAG TPA: ATP synthase F0 subunit B [Candidatus Sulfotelmatobacter sp.]|nr:ATP synthase F0 subunit B [Candidatus Sulfotelmatobacter sp.]
MLLSLDGTVVVQIVNFIVFLAIMNVIFFKPVGAAIARRRAYIDGLKHDVEALDQDVKSLRGQAEIRRHEARLAADEAIAAKRQAFGKETDAIISDAQGRALEIVQKAHAQVETELQSARAQEARIVDALADEMVGRAIGGAA